MGLERWWDALQGIVGKEEIDPFKVWLESLPEWDRVERLDSVIKECFEIGDVPAELLRLASRLPIRAAIRRAFHPGWKFDIMVILKGSQGCGKSTFWKELLPDSEFFSDDLNLAAPSKERIEQITGKVIVESAELRGMSKAEISSLKSFVSRTNDYYRRPWGRGSEDHPRLCVMVGSTNYDECLPNDPSGNRRFLVVPVEKKGPGNAAKTKAYLDTNREQIWAEALAIDKEVKGEDVYLPEPLEEKQAEENEKYRSSPNEIFEEALEAVIQNFPNGELPLVEIQAEVFRDLKISNPDNRDRNAVTAALKNREGVEKLPLKRQNGKPVRLWNLPG